MADGKIIWVDILFYMEGGHRYCEAPRHLAQEIPSRWVMCLVENVEDGGQEFLVQGLCQECMAAIANSMGTTPEEGQL